MRLAQKRHSHRPVRLCMQTAQGKLYLFVAIDRTSKFAYAQLHGTIGPDSGNSILAQPH